ncbi:MAG: exodeoxyribonuclease V subunit alpha [Candidatus Zixiibacteriota bacterium]
MKKIAGLNSIDLHFADFICNLADKNAKDDGYDIIWHIAALLSNKISSGDICLMLKDIENSKISDNVYINDYDTDHISDNYRFPSIIEIQKALDDTGIVSAPDGFAPLIIDSSVRLYMQKYYYYETKIIEKLSHIINSKPLDFDEGFAKSILDRLYPDTSQDGLNWQKIGTALSILRQFIVITGGPGTGKTTTAARAMAFLIAMYRNSGQNAKIAICAPTGKAARRLSDSIGQQVEGIDIDEDIKEMIPREAKTLHRLLGAKWFSSFYRHDADNPLPYNIIIVDESSMVDMPLFAKLLDAIPKNGKLIMLGDKDQLASVEAGHIFGAVCDRPNLDRYSSDTAQKLENLIGEKVKISEKDRPKLEDSIVFLKKNWRFKGGGDIGKLASSIRDGEKDNIMKIMMAEKFPDIEFVYDKSQNEITDYIAHRFSDNFLEMNHINSIEEAASEIDNFSILCALKHGPFGAERIDERVKAFVKHKLGISKNAEYFNGMPIMILKNDPSKSLYNGDIGIVKYSQSKPRNISNDKELRFHIRLKEKEYRNYLIHQLPEHTSCYAMTIHKSQGSEFKEIAVILPDKPSPILTKELFYTAISRAKEKVYIFGKKEIIADMIGLKIKRESGLKERLSLI